MKVFGVLHYYFFYIIKTPVQALMNGLRSVEDFTMIILPESAYNKASALHKAEINELIEECKAKGVINDVDMPE